MSRKIYTPDLIAHAGAIKDSFPTIKSLAQYLSVNADELSKHMRANGFSTQRKKLDPSEKRPDIDLVELAELYNAGVRFDDIVKTFRCSPAIIIAKLKAIGIIFRKDAAKVPTCIDFEIARRIDAQESVLSISRSIGRSRTYVIRRLQRMGINPPTQSEAAFFRMGNLSSTDREILTQTARNKRLSTLSQADIIGGGNPSIGIGEPEFYKALQERNIPFQSQVIVAPYCLDFVVGHIAVEIKSGPIAKGASSLSLDRLEKIFESGRNVLLIAHTGIEFFNACLPHIIATLNRLDSYPPSARKYWVIRCGPYNSAARIKGDKLSPVVITPDYMATLREIY